MHNALMAIAAAYHAGVKIEDACQALGSFINAKRRLEVKGEVNGITVYDDFAHHPEAILATLTALRDKVGGGVRILAVLEPRSNTMKNGRAIKMKLHLHLDVPMPYLCYNQIIFHGCG